VRFVRAFLSAVVLLSAFAGAGCATVQPWQRGRLANPCMMFDANGHQLAFDTHWQTAREAAAGGFGVQAGGCGCK
jgi:Domain of unknown function (DUF4266)